MFERFFRIPLAVENSLFDIINHVDTAGFYKRDRIVSDSAFKTHGSGYQAVLTDTIRIVIRECLRHHHPTGFVDLGCGKGKACLYAWKTGFFSMVAGIDYDARLVTIAQNNAVKRDIDFQHADAVHYQIPEMQNLIFLFNPFDAHVLRIFLDKNIQAIRRTGSIIGYANDDHYPVLKEVGLRCFYRNDSRRISLWEQGADYAGQVDIPLGPPMK